MNISEKDKKALTILSKDGPMMARDFAMQYFDGPEHQYLFTAVSNQGNGACAGKKAWLCAGSLLGRLVKRGLAKRTLVSDIWMFAVTGQGRDLLREASL